MKNIIKFLMATLFIFTAASCSRTDNGVFSVPTVAKTFDNITKLKTLKKQQIAFDMLSSTEKYNLWIMKYNNFLANRNLNDKQVAFVNNIMSQLSPALFNHNTKESKVFQIIKVHKLIQEGKKYFSPNELYTLFFSLKNNKPSITTAALADRECMCAINSKYTCGRITSAGLISIDIEYGTCSEPGCVITNSGCGGLWASECNGSLCSY